MGFGVTSCVHIILQGLIANSHGVALVARWLGIIRRSMNGVAEALACGLTCSIYSLPSLVGDSIIKIGHQP